MVRKRNPRKNGKPKVKKKTGRKCSEKESSGTKIRGELEVKYVEEIRVDQQDVEMSDKKDEGSVETSDKESQEMDEESEEESTITIKPDRTNSRRKVIYSSEEEEEIEVKLVVDVEKTIV